MNQIQLMRRDIAEKLKRRETLFVIDIINACSLRCPSCPIGTYGTRGGRLMPFDLWKLILDKAQRETKISHAQMYSFSDACLHPELHRFVQEATDRKIGTYMSTMLQRTRCSFAKVIEARPTEFRVSMPGWKHMAYYQKGAKPELFDKTFAEVMRLPRHKETLWSMVFHWYKDNLDEFPAVKKLAEDNGLKLVVIPAIFMIPEKIVSGEYTEQEKELISRLLETPEECVAGMKERTTNYCQCWDQITIDSQGDVMLCQLVYEDRFKLMSFLDNPISEIRKAIRSHSFCSGCLAKGVNAYNELYADFTVSEDPIGDMDRFHKKERFLPR